MACMTEVPYNPTDITRQRELLDAIHETYMQDFRASGILSRLVQFELDILADPKAFVRPYRDYQRIPFGPNIDVTAVELGVSDMEMRQRVVRIGHITVAKEVVPNPGFEVEDITLVEGMLEGLRQAYNIGILPNLGVHYNVIDEG